MCDERAVVFKVPIIHNSQIEYQGILKIGETKNQLDTHFKWINRHFVTVWWLYSVKISFVLSWLLKFMLHQTVDNPLTKYPMHNIDIYLWDPHFSAMLLISCLLRLEAVAAYQTSSFWLPLSLLSFCRKYTRNDFEQKYFGKFGPEWFINLHVISLLINNNFIISSSRTKCVLFVYSPWYMNTL